jgi:hypothetical protein
MKKQKDVLQILQEKLNKGVLLSKQEKLFLINHTQQQVNKLHKLINK